MAKVKTERVIIKPDRTDDENRLDFKYDIYVDKEGMFSTTLPKDIVALFKSSGIDMHRNRIGNVGYFSDNTCAGLEQQIKNISKEYMSREIILEKIVIRYEIQTQCAYAISKDGEICPNPGEYWTGIKYDGNQWKGGTVDIHATNRSPFGIQFYIEPSVKRVYKYRSGIEKTEYTRFSHPDAGEIALQAEKKGYYLKWLCEVPNMEPIHKNSLYEIIYDEKIASFFVNLIKSICSLNEKIKDFLTPEEIMKIANNNIKLLG